MYEQFYALAEKPFRITPDPRFLFLSENGQRAFTLFEYGLLERTGCLLLTGAVGTGKTTLVRSILGKLPEQTVPVLIFNTNLTAEQLLVLIMQGFDLTAGKDKAHNLETLSLHLVELYGKGKNPLLIIDEAQNLSDQALEEVRMLLNLQADEQMLLQVVLVGQPEVKTRLRHPGLRQLRQRISVAHHLAALNQEETAAYITSRLQRAGRKKPLFTEEAMTAVHAAASGIPRTVNMLCDAALVFGFADELSLITARTINQVLAQESGLGLAMEKEPPAEPPSLPLPAGTVCEQAAQIRELRAEMHHLRGELDLLEQQCEDRLNRCTAFSLEWLTRQLREERARSEQLLEECAALRNRPAAFRQGSPPSRTATAATPGRPEGQGLLQNGWAWLQARLNRRSDCR